MNKNYNVNSLSMSFRKHCIQRFNLAKKNVLSFRERVLEAESLSVYIKQNIKKIFGISILFLFIFNVFLFSCMSSLNFKLNNHEKRFSSIEERMTRLEKFYADLSTDVVFLKDSLPVTNTVLILQRNNFSTKEILLDTIHERAKEILKGKDEWFEIYRNAKNQSVEKGIPLHVIYCLLQTESSFKYKAISPSGASNGRGLMQVSDIALQEYNNHHEKKYVKSDMFCIAYNMEVGCWYYKWIYDACNKGDPNMTWSDLYVAYNVGFSDYKRNIDSYRKGWDPTRKQKYNALKNWNKNLEYFENYFFA